MDLASPWAIVGFGAALLAAAVIPGLYLWWPSRSQELAKSDLGLALMTGAVIAFSILFLEFLLTQRSNRLETQRQEEADHQALQLLVGRQQVLSGIDLGCSEEDDGSNCGEVLDNFYLNRKILREANLRGSSLQGARLQRAHLEEAILIDAHLEGARLERAHLERAILDRAHLDNANLRFADLQRARAHGTILTAANLNFAVVRADLAYAQMTGARLFGADLTNANLRGANLEGADLRSATLAGANLAGANLNHAKIAGAQFHNARYDRSTHWPFRSDSRWPLCQKSECFVRDTARNDAEAAVATLRSEFARCLPAGWIAFPRDPQGFTFESTIHSARFFGERLRKPPDAGLRAFADDVRRSLRQQLAGFRQQEFREVPLDGTRRLLDLDGNQVLVFRFQYRGPAASGRGDEMWEQLEIYGVKSDVGYRFGGVAPADIFMLFDRDFGRLLSPLGLDPRKAFPSLTDVKTCRPSRVAA